MNLSPSLTTFLHQKQLEVEPYTIKSDGLLLLSYKFGVTELTLGDLEQKLHKDIYYSGTAPSPKRGAISDNASLEVVEMVVEMAEEKAAVETVGGASLSYHSGCIFFQQQTDMVEISVATKYQTSDTTCTPDNDNFKKYEFTKDAIMTNDEEWQTFKQKYATTCKLTIEKSGSKSGASTDRYTGHLCYDELITRAIPDWFKTLNKTLNINEEHMHRLAIYARALTFAMSVASKEETISEVANAMNDTPFSILHLMNNWNIAMFPAIITGDWVVASGGGAGAGADVAADGAADVMADASAAALASAGVAGVAVVASAVFIFLFATLFVALCQEFYRANAHSKHLISARSLPTARIKENVMSNIRMRAMSESNKMQREMGLHFYTSGIGFWWRDVVPYHTAASKTIWMGQGTSCPDALLKLGYASKCATDLRSDILLCHSENQFKSVVSKVQSHITPTVLKNDDYCPVELAQYLVVHLMFRTIVFGEKLITDIIAYLNFFTEKVKLFLHDNDNCQHYSGMNYACWGIFKIIENKNDFEQYKTETTQYNKKVQETMAMLSARKNIRPFDNYKYWSDSLTARPWYQYQMCDTKTTHDCKYIPFMLLHIIECENLILYTKLSEATLSKLIDKCQDS